MIGRPTVQMNLLDGALANRKKRSRREKALQAIGSLVDWDALVKEIEPLYKQSKRGRPSVPIRYMIKILVLQNLYNLSDPEMEDALIDRLSFQRFVGLSFMDEIPDFTTIWRFRERLAKGDVLDKLFNMVVEMIEKKGKVLRKGQISIIDATLVSAARKPPKPGQENSSQKDSDARPAKKGNKGYYGYKGHINMDKDTGLVQRAQLTPANVHDSRVFEKLLRGTERAVFADKAYDSRARKRRLRSEGIFYGILERGRRNHPLTERQKQHNHRKSRIRNPVERVFAHLKRWSGYSRVRYVTLERNALQFMLHCMAYNLKRGLVLAAA